MAQEAFFEAIRQGDLETISSLGEKNPDLYRSRDGRGSTPLILAAYYNKEAVVDHLLKTGVPVDEKDGAGNSALMGCCFKGYEGIARKLIKAGADVNTINSLGSSCLIYAVTFNQTEVAKLLLNHGADIHIRDARGHSALDHAKMQGFNHFLPMLTPTP
ncbi:ankyrin repeat domain-containing protein [Muriicola marianensis]|uniref:Ankyrin repeat domain-containing protein n=1 Tax=Muriicola marianensis TaxID=1324801 RepID=A0ABQ1R1D3_9FLAO|nr:ankyrin repeat domain-containing protein [Muriicola marianensis]GGD51815.1 hypothetical protein GCM10011361_18160 [Muriicola marianensis]